MADLASGDHVSLELRVQHHDGSWLVLSARSAVDSDRARIFFSAVDLTTQKQQEESLREANEQLELFNMAVAHDLRNPLTILSPSRPTSGEPARKAPATRLWPLTRPSRSGA